MEIYNTACDKFPRNRSELSHYIQLHEEWYPNSIEQKC